MVELFNIQQELKAPKDKYNKFGGFPYRNTSGILEAVKPLLNKYKCTLTLCDDLQAVGDRFYIHATATLTNDTGDIITADAWAREQDSKSGMDAAQITGSCSSYARKYALCGLFAIDDSQLDIDAQEETPKDDKHEVKPEENTKEILSEGCPKWDNAIKWCVDNNAQPSAVKKWYQLSEEDERKLKDAVDRKRLAAGDPYKEKDILDFQKEFGLEKR